MLPLQVILSSLAYVASGDPTTIQLSLSDAFGQRVVQGSGVALLECVDVTAPGAAEGSPCSQKARRLRRLRSLPFNAVMALVTMAAAHLNDTAKALRGPERISKDLRGSERI